MSKFNIDWSAQHCGVHQAPVDKVVELLPAIIPVLDTFPDNAREFTWDVKIHMLMPNQYPCIPHWHLDNVPRINGIQRFDLIQSNVPMYCWISGGPLTQFKHGFLLPEVWHRFTQLDEHRGTAAQEFTWRCFIRATHHLIMTPKPDNHLRRHCQVYLDSNTYQW